MIGSKINTKIGAVYCRKIAFAIVVVLAARTKSINIAAYRIALKKVIELKMIAFLRKRRPIVRAENNDLKKESWNGFREMSFMKTPPVLQRSAAKKIKRSPFLCFSKLNRILN